MMSAPPDLGFTFLTQSLNQPWALIGPSTSWQEDGGMNSLQFGSFGCP